MPPRTKHKKHCRKPNAKLSQLLAELGISQSDAEFVLLTAEHDSFPVEMFPDPIHETHLIEILERTDNQHDANSLLAKMLANSTDPEVQATVNRILATNPPEPS